MQPAQRTAGSGRVRALFPFIVWIALSAALFAWQFHRTQSATATIQFVVTGERGATPPRYSATIGETQFTTGEPCGLGRKVLRIAADGFDPFETNVVVGYFGKSLGTIALKRSRGTLELNATPTAKWIEISGPQSNRFETFAHESLLLPTGDYSMVAKFQHVTMERRFTVRKDATTKVELAPPVATLNISSEPGTARFRLESSEITIEQSTPATLDELPAGKYDLTIWQGDYRQRIPVIVRASTPTNEVKVEFTYTLVTITSEPTNAQVSLDGKEIGATPVSLRLQAGRYEATVEKKGFYATNVTFTASGKDPRTLSVELVNSDYVEALERAWARLAANDFDAALKEVEKASLIRWSAEASELKRDIQFARHIHNAREWQQRIAYAEAFSEIEAALKLKPTDSNALALKTEVSAELDRMKQTAADKRRARPLQVFNEITARMRFNELFEAQKLTFKGTNETVRSAIARALGHKPAWNIRSNEKRDGDTAVIHCEMSGFGSKQNAVVVIGQSSQDEVTVHFKIFEFVLGNDIQISLSGISDNSYKPLHPRFASEARAPIVERNLARDIQEFRTRIEDEFR